MLDKNPSRLVLAMAYVLTTKMRLELNGVEILSLWYIYSIMIKLNTYSIGLWQFFGPVQWEPVNRVRTER